MDEMKLLEEFCAAEPDPQPGWLTRARSDLTASIGHARRGGRARLRWIAGPARWPGWLTPLAAAGAVVAAVTVPLAVLPGQNPRSAGGIAASGPGGTPAYFLAESGAENGTKVLAGSTATGKILATAALPHVQFAIPLGAAADDRTFLVGAAPPGGPLLSVFYLAHFHPDSGAISFSRIPGQVKQRENTLSRYSLSPDGSKLAVTTFDLKGPKLTVTIINATTGFSRSWTYSAPSVSDADTISSAWSASSQQFEITWTAFTAQARVQSLTLYSDWLSISRPGTHLPKPHAQALPANWARSVVEQYTAPDGDIIFAVAVDSQQHIWKLEKYSARTHQVSRIFGPVHSTGRVTRIGWVSGNGPVAIVIGLVSDIGFISHGHYTPLPVPAVMRQTAAPIVW